MFLGTCESSRSGSASQPAQGRYTRGDAESQRLVKSIQSLRSGDAYTDVVAVLGEADIDRIAYVDAWSQTDAHRRRHLFYFFDIGDRQNLGNHDKYVQLFFGPDDRLYNIASRVKGVQSWERFKPDS